MSERIDRYKADYAAWEKTERGLKAARLWTMRAEHRARSHAHDLFRVMVKDDTYDCFYTQTEALAQQSRELTFRERKMYTEQLRDSLLLAVFPALLSFIESHAWADYAHENSYKSRPYPIDYTSMRKEVA